MLNILEYIKKTKPSEYRLIPNIKTMAELETALNKLDINDAGNKMSEDMIHYVHEKGFPAYTTTKTFLNLYIPTPDGDIAYFLCKKYRSSDVISLVYLSIYDARGNSIEYREYRDVSDGLEDMNNLLETVLKGVEVRHRIANLMNTELFMSNRYIDKQFNDKLKQYV